MVANRARFGGWGGAGSFTDQYHVDMLVGRIGRLSGFTCADDVGDCADVPPLMAAAPERNTTVHWSVEMPDDTRRMQFDALSGIALQNVSNITTVTGRMPASDKLHDFFPF